MSKEIKELKDNEINSQIRNLSGQLTALNSELHERTEKRNAERRMKKEEEHQKFLKGKEFQKTKERFKELKERIDRFSKTTVEMTIPIRFSFHVSYDGEEDLCIDYVQGEIVGKMPKKHILQTALDNVIGDACEDIYDLFPFMTMEKNKIQEELNDLGKWLGDHGLDFYYLE